MFSFTFIMVCNNNINRWQFGAQNFVIFAGACENPQNDFLWKGDNAKQSYQYIIYGACVAIKLTVPGKDQQALSLKRRLKMRWDMPIEVLLRAISLKNFLIWFFLRINT